MNKNIKIKFFLAFYFCLIIFIYLFYFNLNQVLNSFNFVGRITHVVTSPLKAFWASVSSNFYLQRTSLDEINDLKNQLMESRLDILKYKILEEEITILEREKADLEQALNYKKKSKRKVALAKIILKDPQNLFNTFILDKGSSSGVEEGQVVVTYSNEDFVLFGKITEVTETNARVTTLTDTSFHIGVEIEGTGQVSISEGQASTSTNLIVHYFDRSLEDIEGRSVVTSFVGEYYPDGIPVGEIIETVNKDGIFQSVLVKPYVNFFNVKYVYILQNTP